MDSCKDALLEFGGEDELLVKGYTDASVDTELANTQALECADRNNQNLMKIPSDWSDRSRQPVRRVRRKQLRENLKP